MLNEILKDAEEKFQSTRKIFQDGLATIRSGQTNPALVENLEVNAYDGVYSLKELAAISVPEVNIILIQPWDESVTESIAKAITASNLGLNPSIDGAQIRLNIPALSAERRKQMQRLVGEKSEDAKLAVRNIRQHKIKSFDEMKEASKISEDERDQARKQLQEMVDEENQFIDQLREKKIKSLEEF